MIAHNVELSSHSNIAKDLVFHLKISKTAEQEGDRGDRALVNRIKWKNTYMLECTGVAKFIFSMVLRESESKNCGVGRETGEMLLMQTGVSWHFLQCHSLPLHQNPWQASLYQRHSACTSKNHSKIYNARDINAV